eukprot:TRINITY_DN4310_c1_g1_i2.p1 TRINITY_DN4310_c1_g1~~TRINITY_DN4310_c1_g1_i2.p1  ORF type:complete len:838 (-),score=123.43 TRINITY_DN4310_c1_g1_i2:133-2646(-)
MRVICTVCVIVFGIISVGRCQTCTTVGEIRSFGTVITEISTLENDYAQICLQTGGTTEWRHICSKPTNNKAWSYDNLYVWCRTMKKRPRIGFEGSLVQKNDSTDSTKVFNVNCNRTEDNNILSCDYDTTTDPCRYLHGIRCDDCSDTLPCNGGTCTNNGTCECNEKCMNEGICDLGLCLCRHPYYGDSCQYKRCVLPCEEGSCNETTGTCSKTCPNMCGGNGECNDQTGFCECEEEYFGDTCQSKNCKSSCSNNETCDYTRGVCQCKAPYYGDRCQYTGRNCSSDCLNGGSCDYRNATCECVGGFEGNSCEITHLVPENNLHIYIIVAVCLSVVLVALVAGIVLLCLLVVRINRTSEKPTNSKDIISVEEQPVQEKNGALTGSKGGKKAKPKPKLKANKSYIKSSALNNRGNGINLNENKNGDNSHYYSGLASSYTQLGDAKSIEHDAESMYEFLNTKQKGEELYQEYTEINDSILPTRNATIVLSQEERDSIHSQGNETIYETCLRWKKDSKVVRFSDQTEYCLPPDNLPKIFDRMSSMKFREINPDTLQKESYIGSGEFGMVYKGSWDTGQKTIEVAMKILKSSDESVKTAFMREAAIMGQFSHPNVLTLLGILSLTEPFMIVTEFMKADLPRFLVNLKPSGIDVSVIPPVLLRFCIDIATGMEYLASKNCVHRDLAARNILLTRNMVCKIADFGMSREFKENYDYYKSSGGLIPVKWTAPEAIFYQKYTEKSDVWAFGMTMFEIWSLGYTPWHNKSNEEILHKLQSRKVQHPPTGCPKGVYDVMLQTWNYEVDQRVTFKQVLELLAHPIQHQNKTSSDPADSLGNDPALVPGFD